MVVRAYVHVALHHRAACQPTLGPMRPLLRTCRAYANNKAMDARLPIFTSIGQVTVVYIKS